MKKEQIIRLAKEKKFVSEVLYNNQYKYSNNEDKRWLFWLTELQAWLRENYDVDIDVMRNDNEWNNFIKEKHNLDSPLYRLCVLNKGDVDVSTFYGNNEYVKCLEHGIVYSLENLI